VLGDGITVHKVQAAGSISSMSERPVSLVTVQLPQPVGVVIRIHVSGNPSGNCPKKVVERCVAERPEVQSCGNIRSAATSFVSLLNRGGNTPGTPKFAGKARCT
jgi:hypothetical protein